MERLKLEDRFKEFKFEVVDDKKIVHRITYQTNGDLIKSSVYELFMCLYDDFKNKYMRKKDNVY